MRTVFYSKKKDTQRAHLHREEEMISFCQYALENTEKIYAIFPTFPNAIFMQLLDATQAGKVTYNRHIHNVTVYFRCTHAFMSEKLLYSRYIRSII